jgi:hypothetical protein
MCTTNNHFERPTRNIVWHLQPHPSPCEVQHDAIAHQVAGTLKRCLKHGTPEIK